MARNVSKKNEQSGGSTSVHFDAENYDHILAAAKAGSDQAFTALWQHFQPKMVRYLTMFTKDSEDLASEVWIKIAASIQSFEGDAAAFKGWIYTIARNAATDLARRNSRLGSTVELNEGDWTSENSTMVEVMDLIKRLPEEYAEVILLRVVAGLEVKDVAEIIGKEPGNVRVLTHRGLKQLSEMLGEGGEKI